MKLTFDHPGFVVSNVHRSLRFYQDMFGLKLKSAPIEDDEGTGITTTVGIPGHRLIAAWLEFPGGLSFELIQFVAPKGKKTMDTERCDVGAAHIALSVPDVLKYYEELKAKGVRFVEKPMPNPRGDLTIYFFDPDGFIIELMQNNPTYKFDHLSFGISNQEKCKEFYGDILGLKPMGDMVEFKGTPGRPNVVGYPGVYLKNQRFDLNGGYNLELLQYVAPAGKRKMEIQRYDVGASVLGFLVDDVMQDYYDLKAKGVRFVQPPVPGEKGDLAAFCFDPDGFSVQLKNKPRPK